MSADPPVIGVCGPSGSGKTLLIQQLVPRLIARGLRVGVVKHSTRRIEADRPGKDTDRIFQAGADVLAAGPGESFARFHADEMPLAESLRRLSGQCDLVLVEGNRDATIPKIWVTQDAADDYGRPEEELLVLPKGADSWHVALDVVWRTVERAHAALPVLAAVLIGGSSSRMGRPKHLLERPGALSHLERLPDAQDAEGPLGGLLSALRWQQRARWIVMACDLPMATPQAVAWLLEQVRPGLDAVMPAVRGQGGCEPLFAIYEPTALWHAELAAARGEFSLHSAFRPARVLSPQPPPALQPAWTNVNTPDDWRRISRRIERGSM